MLMYTVALSDVQTYVNVAMSSKNYVEPAPTACRSVCHLPPNVGGAQITSGTISRSITLIASNYYVFCSHTLSSIIVIFDILHVRLVKMEEKRNTFTSEQREKRSNDVGPETFAPTLPEILITSEATTRWKGPRYLAYDFYDAYVRSFLNRQRYLSPTSTSLSTGSFFYSDKTQPFLLTFLQCEYVRRSQFFSP
jgi:hypothetical protein